MNLRSANFQFKQPNIAGYDPYISHYKDNYHNKKIDKLK